MNSNSPNQTGFTLLELAIVLLISGLLLVAAIMIATPILRQAQMTQTNAKLANIARAIDFYATQNYRVPCPASPDTTIANPPTGYEMGSNVTGSGFTAGCNGAANWVGIVPYKTLNIPVDWVRDAWGHYITYAVSPDFTQNPNTAALNVHAACRTADWFAAGVVYEQNVQNGTQLATALDANGNPAPAVLLPKNSRKARFCCPGINFGNDLVIRDGNNQPQIALTRSTAPVYVPPVTCATPGTPAQPAINEIDYTLYAPANQPYAAQCPRPAGTVDTNSPAPGTITPNVQVPLNQRPTAAAYVLISHGVNGNGAYIGNGAASRVPAATATADEKANATDGGPTRAYYDIAKIDRTTTAGEQGFDDVVLWRTQDAMFAEQGKSCALP